MGEAKSADEVRKGLIRLAFGSISDAVRLVCLDGENLSLLGSLDLFNISRFRKTKDGFEIEVFDRQKALEALRNLESAESVSAAELLCEAISRGAEAAGKSHG
jgi:hypothetical protein